MKCLGAEKQTNEHFTNKKFVITGTIDGYSREEIKRIIESYDGSVSDSVSSKTNVVIVGKEPGSKYDKAMNLGIDIWNEEKIIKILSEVENAK